MYWPTSPGPAPLPELGWVNSAYLGTASPRCDPTIVWGTTVDVSALEQFISNQRKQTGVMISHAHVLLRAVTESIHRNPLLNRRVIGRKVFQYDGVHVTMPMLETRSGEVNVVFLKEAEKMSLTDISRRMWEEAREAAVRSSSAQRTRRNGTWVQKIKSSLPRFLYLQIIHKLAWLGFSLSNRFRCPTWVFEDMNGANAFVNYLGFPGAPPMTSYKPSLLPTNSFSVSVTMGATQQQPVAEIGTVVVRPMAPVYIRVDHRLVNGHQTARFVSTLRNLLLNPEQLSESNPLPANAAA